jgi:hypothetical protein
MEVCCGSAACGRFGYSDLKEAAVSRAAGLWALNGGALLLEGWEPLVRVWSVGRKGSLHQTSKIVR